MRILILLARVFLFLVLLGFAIKNDGLVTVRAYFDTQWQLPLVALMVIMLTAGFLLGATAVASQMMALRSELARLRKLLPADVSSTRPGDLQDPA